MRNEVRQWSEIGGLQRFVRDEGKTGSSIYQFAQRMQIASRVSRKSGLAQNLGGNLRVASPWCEDDGALGQNTVICHVTLPPMSVSWSPA